MIGEWINEGNLKPLMETLSYLIDYAFDESDWIAIEIGTNNTTEHKGDLYEYRLYGGQTLIIQTALDSDAGLVLIQIEGNEEILEKCKVVLWIVQSYSLTAS